MDIIKYMKRLGKMDDLVRRKTTGTPGTYECKNNILAIFTFKSDVPKRMH